MTTSTRWVTAVLFILALMAIGCASGIDLSKIPPPQIIIGTPSVEPKPHPDPAPSAPRATVALEVVDACDGQPIAVAVATFDDTLKVPANNDGYIAIELEQKSYAVKVSAPDYQTVAMDIVLTGNRQFPPTRMRRVDGCPAPPTPAPPKVDPPKVDPPVVVVTPREESAGWSDEQWRAFILPLLKKTGDRVNEANLKLVRPELVARGADFQNGWRGDMRARVFLPVQGCPSSAITPDPLPCAYNRTFDLGLIGEPWTWIKR